MKRLVKLTAAIAAAMSIFAGTIPGITHAADISDYAKKYGVKIVSEEEYAKVQRNFRFVDISKQANMGFADEIAGDGKGGWSDQGSSNDMSYFDKFGKQTSYGITMNIIDPAQNDGKSVITLAGQNDTNFPTKVEVPVDDTCQSIYTVTAAAWSSGVVGLFRLVYEDGDEAVITMEHNVTTGNWWGKNATNLIRPFWTGKNDSTENVIMHVTGFANPKPEKKIKTISLETTGKGSYMMVVAISLSDEEAVLPEIPPEPVNELFNPDYSDWYKYDMFEYDKLAGSSLDVSNYREAPAGKHGRLTAENGDLKFEDGSDARFWGGNIVLITPTSTKEEIDKFIEYIKSCGMNIARFHHMDSPTVTNNIYGAAKETYEFDPVTMDNFCYFWYKCKEAGIYIGLEMIVSSKPIEGYGIQAIEDIVNGFKFEGMFDRTLIDIQKRYAEQMLTWKNPYTGTTLAEDPAVAYIEITNENNLSGYGTKNTSNFTITTDYYRTMFRELFNDWLKEKYGNDETLRKAWEQDGAIGLKEGESIEDKSVEIPAEYRNSGFSDARGNDCQRFMGDVQLKYFREMESWFKSLGYDGLVLGSANIITEVLSDVYINAQLDVVDRHQYYAHPVNGYDVGSSAVSSSETKSLATQMDKNIWSTYTGQRVYNKPFFISEWNDCIGNQFNIEGMLMLSAMSMLQGWNPMIFEIAGGSWATTTRNQMSMFDVMGQPLRMQFMPLASRMFLRGDVKELEKQYFKPYTEEQIFDYKNQYALPENRTVLYGKTGIQFEDVGVCENDMTVLEKAKNEQQPMVSATGEIVWNNEIGQFYVHTDKTQAFSGMVNNEKQYFESFEFDIENPFALMALQSVEDKPIDEAEHLSLFAGGRVANTDMKLKNDGTGWISGGTAPQIIEPIKGTLTIKNHNKYKLYALDSSGVRIRELPVNRDENGYSVITLCADNKAISYDLEVTEFGNNEKPAGFIDVCDYLWAADAINTVSEKNILKPESEKLFLPQKNITRGQYAGMIVRALELDDNGENFPDVTVYNDDAKEIATAKSLGIVKGDENGNFNPYNPITREDAMVMLMRALKADGGAYVKKAGFYDGEEISEYAKYAVYKAAEMNYVHGNDENRFMPKSNMTRAEASVLIANILK